MNTNLKKNLQDRISMIDSLKISMVCPECKRPLEATDLVAVTMWD